MTQPAAPQWVYPAGLPRPEVVLAIVGTTTFLNPDAYSLMIPELQRAFDVLNPTKVISGNAQGADTFGELWATVVRPTPFQGFPPANRRWEPNGYKERNVLIATRCTHLLALRCQGKKTYGSGFTADAATALGKVVRRVTIPIAGFFTTADTDWPEAMAELRKEGPR